MAVQVSWWDDEETILHLRFFGNFGIADLQIVDEQRLSLTQYHNHPFHVIYNFRDAHTPNKGLPRGLLSYLREDREKLHPPQMEFVFVIVPSWMQTLAKSIIHISRSIYPKHGMRTQLVDSLDDALTFIQKQETKKVQP